MSSVGQDAHAYPRRTNGPLRPIAAGNRVIIKRPHMRDHLVSADQRATVANERFDHDRGRPYLAQTSTERLETVIFLPSTGRPDPYRHAIGLCDVEWGVHPFEPQSLPVDHRACIGYCDDAGPIETTTDMKFIRRVQTAAYFPGCPTEEPSQRFQQGELVYVSFGPTPSERIPCVVLGPRFRYKPGRHERVSVIQTIPYIADHDLAPEVFLKVDVTEGLAHPRSAVLYMVRTFDHNRFRDIVPVLPPIGHARSGLHESRLNEFLSRAEYIFRNGEEQV